MDNERIEHHKRKLAELEEKVCKLKNELEAKKTAKARIPFEDQSLEDDIPHLNDLIEFYSKEIKNYNAKLKKLEVGVKEETPKTLEIEKNVQESFKLIFEESEKHKIKAWIKPEKLPVKYAVAFALILVIITSLFLFRPAFTGHVVLSKEKTYSEALSLRINESGTYEWNVKNPGSIKSLKASGSIIGNGTVKIYIEKDGKRYLIYQRT